MEARGEGYWLKIQREPLDIVSALEFLRADGAGAVDIFLGTTRRWTDGRETVRLEYECYDSMAIREMRRLTEEAADMWQPAKLCLIHRDGEVSPREISVIVGVSATHRDEAFRACRFLIDALKRRVPIWKRERFADGTTEWVEGVLPDALSSETLQRDS